jgi:hypothetical protein
MSNMYVYWNFPDILEHNIYHSYIQNKNNIHSYIRRQIPTYKKCNRTWNATQMHFSNNFTHNIDAERKIIYSVMASLYYQCACINILQYFICFNIFSLCFIKRIDMSKNVYVLLIFTQAFQTFNIANTIDHQIDLVLIEAVG